MQYQYKPAIVIMYALIDYLAGKILIRKEMVCNRLGIF